MSVQAEELILYLKKGGQVSFALEKKPVITFVKDTIVVRSDILNYSVSISDIEKYNIKEFTTDHQRLKNENVNPEMHNGHVFFSNLVEGCHVYVYDTTGKLLYVNTADQLGQVDVDLTSLPEGIFILKSPVVNIKMYNK